MTDTYLNSYNPLAVQKEFSSTFKDLEEAKETFIRYYGDIDKFKGGDNEVRDTSMEESMALVAFGFCHVCAGNGGYWCCCCSHRACPCAATNQAFYVDCCDFCDGTGQWKDKNKKIDYTSEAHKDQFEKSERAISKFEEQKKEKERLLCLDEENEDYQRFTAKERRLFKDGMDCLVNSKLPFQLKTNAIQITRK